MSNRFLVLVQDSASRGVVRDGNYGPVKNHLADNYYYRGQKGSILNKICEYDQILTIDIFAMIETKWAILNAS